MKKITLNKGFHSTVDDKDFETLSEYTWFISDTGYAKSTLWKDGKAKQIRMHRILMKPKKGQMVDHINGDKLDNRKSNLRLCSNAENMRNRLAPTSNKTGFKGVSWMASRNKWRARLKVNYKEMHLGLFSTKELAAKAYNEAATSHFKDFANLNTL